MGQDAAKIRRPFLVSKQRRPFLSERAPLFGFSEPGRLLLPEPGLRAVGVGVVTAQVAAELLETGDLPRCRPADQGHTLEHLPAAVVHPVGEGPLHHRLVPLVEELADIPPVLHMGSCVDISRMMILAAELAKDSGLNISQLPVVGCAPEWMSEKAVSIGNYVVATGIDTFLGVDPYVSGSDQIAQLLTEGVRDWVEAAYTVEKDIDKLGDAMIERIEEKRTALGI